MKPVTIASLVIALLCAATASAQQSGGRLTTLYDTNNPVTLVGEIVEVEWSTPRARLHVMDEATAKHWIVTGGSPHDLTAEQRASVHVGEAVRVTAFRMRNDQCDITCHAYGDTFTKADGSPLVTPPLASHNR